MSVVDEILTAHDHGARCGVSAATNPSVVDVAAEFGLRAERRVYREIDAATARAVVCHVLSRGLVYHTRYMSPDEADRLAAAFLDLFGPAALYFGNGWRPPDVPGERMMSNSWTPATDATFDTGVVVVGPERSGCLWVEDED